MSVSAFPWSSRAVASQIADRFDFNAPFQPYEALQFDFEYITPKSHLELLSGIVAADLSTFKGDVKDCLAASFHCDASMDRTQKDNEYMVLKTIDRDGKESLNYVGLGFVTGQGA